MVKSIRTLVVAAVFFCTLPPLAAQQAVRTFIGVVRADGSMLVIGVFDGRNWLGGLGVESVFSLEELPPAPQSLLEVPAAWLPPGVRLPTEWQLHPTNGRSVAVKALRPIRTEYSHGQYNIGLQIDYSLPGGDVDTRVGLAVSGPGRFAPFVAAPRRESDSIAKQLAPRLAAIEQMEIAKFLAEARLPASSLRRVFRDSRRTEPVAFSLRRAARAASGNTYYHLTGEKLYLTLGDGFDRECKLNLSLDGVVTVDGAGRVTSENVTAFAWNGFCGDRAMWKEPVATIEVGNRLFWIMMEGLEDGSRYFLIDPDAKEVPLQPQTVQP